MTRRVDRRATTFSVAALVACLVAVAYVEVAAPANGGRTEVLGSAVFAPSTASEEPTAPPQPQDGSQPPGTDGPGAGGTGGADATQVVRFVYFVEQDQDADPAAVELIAQQAASLQRLWYDQFGGTFAVADAVDVVYGDHPSQWYDTSPVGDDPRWFRLINIRDEIERQLGLDGPDPSTRYVAYPEARIDGRVGAYRYRGAVMDGDDISCITGEVTTTPYSPDFPADCLATVAHELGHVFGLGHQGPEEDCMQFGFYRYMAPEGTCRFSAPNRAAVIDDPANEGWLDATPGDTGPSPVSND